MDFNELKRKYGQTSTTAGQTVTPEPPRPAPAPTPKPAPAPKPTPAPKPAQPPTPRPVPVPPETPKPSAPPAITPQQDFGGDSGVFGHGSTPSVTGRQTGNRSARNRAGSNFSMSDLSSLPWADIIMIALTVIGILAVILNFDAVTVIIAAFIGQLVQSLTGLILVAAVIAGIVLIVSWRRGRR